MPDLSFHVVTVEPERTNELKSLESNHNCKLGKTIEIAEERVGGRVGASVGGRVGASVGG